MDRSQFDRVTRLFSARRLSRRTALAGAAAGAAAAALGKTVAGAQQATPVAAETDLSFLFLQSFNGASITPGVASPTAGDATLYTLTLSAGLGQTLYFSDRPERIVGTVPTPVFLDGLGFTPTDPPNAALVANRANGDTEILVLELFNPGYDEAANTATYDVHILQNDERVDLTFTDAPQFSVPALDDLTAANLFIDDCADATYCCKTSAGDQAGYITVGRCWDWSNLWCNECRDDSDVCNATFPDACQGNCSVGNC